MWAVAEVLNNPVLSLDIRRKAKEIFLRAFPHAEKLTHLRSQAFVIKALIIAQKELPEHRAEFLALIHEFAKSLVSALNKNSDGSWNWFEGHLGYSNALLSESLLLAGSVLKNEEYLQLGKSSLQFLIDKTFLTNMYVPIGHAKWYKKNEERSYFDQQPEDPCSMILALATAYTITHVESYKNLANKCFSWFLGNNSLHQSLYDYESGGCYDGLHPDRVNLNQGAESLVSYLLSRLAMTKLEAYENSTTTEPLS